MEKAFKPRLRVLYLEDDPRDAELVQETLAADGIESDIIRVETEGDFIAALKQGGFDLVLADYTLPSSMAFRHWKSSSRTGLRCL